MNQNYLCMTIFHPLILAGQMEKQASMKIGEMELFIVMVMIWKIEDTSLMFSTVRIL